MTTTSGASFDDMVRQMVGMGINRAKAEHAAGLAVANTRRQSGDDRATQGTPEAVARVLALPVTLIVPWSALVSDNQRHTATIRAGKPLIVMGGRYREAKDKIRNLARHVAKDAAPADGDLELLASFWLPDRRVHDITNLAKILCDGLEGIFYSNDSQLVETHWRKVATDIDAPRAEITVSRR